MSFFNKGFESKTVISNLSVDYMCVSALCVNKYSLLPDYEEENMEKLNTNNNDYKTTASSASNFFHLFSQKVNQKIRLVERQCARYQRRSRMKIKKRKQHTRKYEMYCVFEINNSHKSIHMALR